MSKQHKQMRARLVKIYECYNTSQLKHIDALCEKYHMTQEELFKRLEEKYGPDVSRDEFAYSAAMRVKKVNCAEGSKIFLKKFDPEKNPQDKALDQEVKDSLTHIIDTLNEMASAIDAKVVVEPYRNMYNVALVLGKSNTKDTVRTVAQMSMLIHNRYLIARNKNHGYALHKETPTVKRRNIEKLKSQQKSKQKKKFFQKIRF
uniref:Uncharacterized protein n=1 Tax=Megaviridae environmental sample TaxID=1737588 RepID=A0A5J6VIK9_9VIRU|nr:MAG: hypothetical protein [Megaviridae environmental sample]